MLQSKEEVQYIKSVITDSLSSVQVKTRLACFSFLLLKFVFAAHFCASEFSLPELRLFVLLRRTSFQESSGSVYYSIFDFQGSVLQKVFRFTSAETLIFLVFFLLLLSCFLRQLVYLNTRLWDCQAIFCLFFRIFFHFQETTISWFKGFYILFFLLLIHKKDSCKQIAFLQNVGNTSRSGKAFQNRIL